MGLKATWHDGGWGMGWWVLLSSGNQFHQIISWGKAGLAVFKRGLYGSCGSFQLRGIMDQTDRQPDKKALDNLDSLDS